MDHHQLQEMEEFSITVDGHRQHNPTSVSSSPESESHVEHENENVQFWKKRSVQWFFMMIFIYSVGMAWKHVPIFIEESDYFQKSNMEEVQSIITINLYGYLIYYVSNVENLPSPFKPIFIIPCTISSVIFPLVGKLQFMAFSLSKKSVHGYTTSAWLVVSLTVVLILFVCAYHAYKARNSRRKALHYLVPLLLLPVILITMFPPISPVIDSTHIQIHLHHAFVACIYAMFCDQNNRVSRISQGVSMGIFIQGVCFYGSKDATLFA